MVRSSPNDPAPSSFGAPHGGRKTRRVLNVPLLIGTVIVMAVASPVAYCWHTYQVNRTADGLARHADLLVCELVKEQVPKEVIDRKPGDQQLADWVFDSLLDGAQPALRAGLDRADGWEEAAAFYYQYLRFRPDDSTARIRLAVASDLWGQQAGRAVKLWYHALGTAPPDHEPAIRQRLGELLLKLGQWKRGQSYPNAAYLARAEEQAWALLQPSEETLRKAWNDKRADDPQLPAKPGREDWWHAEPELFRKDRPQAWRLLALALSWQEQVGTLEADRSPRPPTGEVLERALQLSPGHIELSVSVARMYREEEQPFSGTQPEGGGRQQQADAVIDEMVAVNPRDPAALLARYNYRVQYGLSGAEEDLAEALKHGPDNIHVLLTAAANARRNAEKALRDRNVEETLQCLEQARSHYRRVIDQGPVDSNGYLGLGDVHLGLANVYRARNEREMARRHRDLAVTTWQRGLKSVEQGVPGNVIELNARLAAALLMQGKLDDSQQVLDDLDSAIAKLAASLDPPTKNALDRSSKLLRARWQMLKGEFRRAIPLLMRVAPYQHSTAAEVAEGLQAWMMLGQSYGALGLWDKAAAAFEEAASLRPKALAAHLAAADAWTKAGQSHKAIQSYKKALVLRDSAALWLGLAQARLHRQERLPEKDRDWGPFEEALEAARTPKGNDLLPNPGGVAILEARYLALRGEEQKAAEPHRDARDLLRTAEDAYSGSAAFLRRLALSYEQLGYPADADRVLAKHDAVAAGSPASYLLRAQLYAARADYARARDALQAGLKQLPGTYHAILRQRLAQISLQKGDYDEARRILESLRERNPSDIMVLGQLADIALLNGRLEELERRERELRALEGSAGSYWRYYRARRLLAVAKTAKDPAFMEADRLQQEIHSRRPAWAFGYLLRGLIAQGRGQFEEAVEAYEEAVRLGDRSLFVFERLIPLLFSLQRVDEAGEYLAGLPQSVRSSGKLEAWQVYIAAGQGKRDVAVRLARQMVEKRPEDPVARIRLGEMLAADHHTDEAELEFQKAVQLAPNDVRTHDALFRFYLRTRQRERAKEVIQALQGKVELPGVQLALVLASRYEALGDREQAEVHYRNACRLDSKNLGVQMRLAEFLARSNDARKLAEAESILSKLPETDFRAAARRMRASILARMGGEANWTEAQRLLAESDGLADASGLDRRLQALLLIGRGGEENRTKAQRLLEQLVRDAASVADGDRLQLARLYEEGNLPEKARAQYEVLVRRADPSPVHLGLYFDFLLRHGELGEAEDCLNELQEKAPDSLGTLARKVRWLDAQPEDRTTEIQQLVDAFAAKQLEALKGLGKSERQPKEAQLALAIGEICRSVKQFEAAERYFGRVRELLPGQYRSLAVSLAQQNRMQEAIRLCLEAAKSDDSPRPAMIVADALAAGHPTEGDFQLAEPLLARAVREHADEIQVLFTVANVRILQRRPADAVRLYEQVLQLQPKHVVALNNLATVLGEQPGKRETALRYVDRAIRIAGQQPPLLDTKAMILVHKGTAEANKEAVSLLERAVGVIDADPRFHFHLAVAYARTDELQKARAALAKAHAGDLAGQILTEMEQKLLAGLEQKLR